MCMLEEFLHTHLQDVFYHIQSKYKTCISFELFIFVKFSVIIKIAKRRTIWGDMIEQGQVQHIS